MAEAQTTGAARDPQTGLPGFDLDAVLDAVAAFDEKAREMQIEVDESRAARMERALYYVRTELENGRRWWERRREALVRQEGWLLAQLDLWARGVYGTTGLKTIPIGLGSARVQKARARQEWQFDSPELIVILYAAIQKDPKLVPIDKIDKGRAFTTLFEWGRADSDGIARAVHRETGEELEAVRLHTRPGELSVSIAHERP